MPGPPGSSGSLRCQSQRFLLAVLLFVLASGCGKSPDPVQATLDRITQAAEERSAEGIVAELAEEFRAATGEGKSEISQSLRQILAGYERLSIKLSSVSVERAPGLARVTFRAGLSGVPRTAGGLEGFLPRSAAYEFELRLVERGNRFVVEKADWKRAP